MQLGGGECGFYYCSFLRASDEGGVPARHSAVHGSFIFDGQGTKPFQFGSRSSLDPVSQTEKKCVRDLNVVVDAVEDLYPQTYAVDTACNSGPFVVP